MAKATEPIDEKLVAITRQLHDLWFDVSDVRFDQPGRTVTIPFLAKNQPRERGAGDRWLRIGEVEHFRLEETEGVGRYDFNEFDFSPTTGTLRVSTGIPLRLEATVTRLDVSLGPSPGE